MLRPFLLVGVGGSGGKTLRAIRQSLELRLLQEGWKGGWPKAWQILHVDTPLNQDGEDFPAPFLPLESYQGLVSTGTTYKEAYNEVLKPGKIPTEFRNDAEKSLPHWEKVTVPLHLGAGQYRAVGRTPALGKLSVIARAAQAAITRLNSAEAIGQLETIGAMLGAKPGNASKVPTVIVISSIAGGSGAGQYIDVTEAIKSADPAALWVHEIFALLYAPDVFDKLDDIQKAGIPPNALAAFSEAMSGLWHKAPPPATEALYKSHGLVVPSNSPNYSIGPKFMYVIGRSNSSVDFGDQPAVYNAVAAGVSTWITDDRLQGKMLSYAIGNFDQIAKSAISLPDHSGLKLADGQAPPFSSMGFGRVSLGKDRFLQYASERLARSGIDQMLYKHSEEDPLFKTKTQDEWIAFKADSAIISFISDLKLNEETEQHNDVIDALRPIEQREMLYATLKNQVLADAQQGLDKSGGQSISNWHDKLIHFYQIYVERANDEETNNRHAKAREWVGETQERIQKVTSQYISQYGLRVVSELLNRVEMKIDAVSAELITEANAYRRYASEVRSYVGQELQNAQGHESLRPDHPAVQQAAEQCKNALGWRAEADLREMAADLMRDLAQNFIKPLRVTVSGGERALLAGATDAKVGEQNPYLGWAKVDSNVVPMRFTPGKNERLLIDVVSYPEEFSELIARSVDKDRAVNAFGVVMDQVLMGALELDDLDEDATWALLDVKRHWIPNYRGARRDSSQSSQAVQFEFSSEPIDYLKRAQLWMERQGTAFYAYLHEDLVSYLDENMKDKAVLTQRITKFREEFSAAVASSEPLVKLNAGLLMSVHGKTIGEVSAQVSAIPFPIGGNLYESIKTAFQIGKLWKDSDSDGWFRDIKVQNIDIFTTLPFPYQPMVMDSLVQPIAKQWLAEANVPEKRAAFLKQRRARSLGEFIPIAPEVRNQMIRGWYVSKVLSQLDDDAETADTKLGPEVTIWVGPGNQRAKFPHPLMHEGFCPGDDFPAAVLKSVAIAIVMCNAVGSLDPLQPYQRLSELGGVGEMLAVELNNWIHYGSLAAGAPIPKPERAGAAESTFEGRKDAVLAYLETQEVEFREHVLTTKGDDVRSYGLSWELRTEIVTEIHDLKTSVMSMRAVRSGT